MTTALTNWITICLMFLLPMIPGFLLYRFLPSSGEVGGKIFGMPIKLGGSIAGYVVVLLIGLNYGSLDDVAGSARYKLYTIGGTVSLQGDGAELDNRQLVITYAPRREEVGQPYGAGAVDWKAMVLRPADKGADGDRPMADILISYPDYVTEKLPLAAAETNDDQLSMAFKPIVLRKKLKAQHVNEGTPDALILQ